MKNVVVCYMLLAGFFINDAAAADDKKPAYCENLLNIMRLSSGGIVAGSWDAKLQIALAAHERLNCPAGDLLTVLNISNKAPLPSERK